MYRWFCTLLLATALVPGAGMASAHAHSGIAGAPDVGVPSSSQGFVQEAQTPVPDWLGPIDVTPRQAPTPEALFRDPESPVLGNPGGDVTVVEFFDYHCAYCKSVIADLMELIDTDPGIRLVMKEYPILSEDSVTAAKAALAALKQGRYRQMHEALMSYRGQFTKGALEWIAGQAGVDPRRMFLDMEAADIEAQISSNLDQGAGLGFTGTPGFVFGSAQAPGALTLDEMRELVAAARRKG